MSTFDPICDAPIVKREIYPLIVDDIEYEIKLAKKHIRQSNKGLPKKVEFRKWYIRYVSSWNGYALQLTYLDGNGDLQSYNIAM